MSLRVITSRTQLQAVCLSKRFMSFSTTAAHNDPVYTLLDKPVRKITRKDLASIKTYFRQFDAEGREEPTSVTFDPGFSPGIGLITLRNPEKLNAFTGRMMADLTDIVDSLEAATALATPDQDMSSNDAIRYAREAAKNDHGPFNSLVGIILHGEGRGFCAGLDLSVAKKHIMTPESGALMSLLMRDTLSRLRRLSLISVAAIEGVAFGAGAELATTCDFRIMAQDSRVRFVQTKMFTTPVWAGGAFGLLEGGKGASRSGALRALGAAEVLTSSRAIEFGFADAGDDPIVDKGDAVDGAKRFLDPFVYFDPQIMTENSPNASHAFSLSPTSFGDNIKRNSVEAVRGMKTIISKAVDPPQLDSLMDLQHLLFCGFWGSEENKDAVVNVTRK